MHFLTRICIKNIKPLHLQQFLQTNVNYPKVISLVNHDNSLQSSSTIHNISKSNCIYSTSKRDFSSLNRIMALQQLNALQAKDIMENVDTFLFDCGGVLWDAHGVIEGSKETIIRLKELGKKVFYVTNTSIESRDQLVDKFKDLGFPAEKDEIVCTSYIAAAYLQQVNFKGQVYLMGKQESVGAELDKVGISYFGPGPDPLQGTVDDWLKMSVDPEIGCVLIGWDPHISYMKIMKAASYLKNPECLYLATNMDNCQSNKTKVTVPGAGCIVHPVSHASRRQPQVMGKPEMLMFDVLKKEHGLNPARCLMTGDTLTTDILFAQKCGMKSLLVLSGNTSLEDASNKDAAAVPDLYAPCFGELLKFI